MYGLTRGVTLLIAAAIAGALLWFAAWTGPRDSNRDYWIAMGVAAGAGLTIALSQIVGGWTKWGRPTASPAVFLLAFLPVLVVGGWVLVATQPHGNEAKDYAVNWAGDIGVGGLLSTLALVAGPIAFAIGLVFGMVFDTTGERRRVAAAGYDDRYAAEEPTASERALAGRREREHAGTRDREYAGRGQRYDGTRDDGYDATRGDGYDRNTEVAQREPVGVGGRTAEEQTTPSAPQPDPESRPRRRSFFRR